MRRWISSAWLGAAGPVAVGIVGLGLVAAGCDCGGAVERTCTVNADCPTGEMCIDGVCAPARDAGPDAGMDSATPRDAGPVPDGAINRDSGVIPPGECRIEPSAQPFENPSLDLHWNATGQVFPNYSQAIHSPVVIDFIDEASGDPVPEIIFITYRDGSFNAGVLRVVSGRPPYDTLLTLAGDGTGPVVDDTMATPRLLQDCHPAAGDLDGDGRPEVVVSLAAGGAIALKADGTELWRVSAADLPSAEIEPNGSWAIHDLEGDGQPEVVVGRVVLEGRTGVVRFTGSGSRGLNRQGPLSCVADVVSASSGQEIIAGHTVYSATGEVLWSAAGGSDGFCAVADILTADGNAGRDGLPEVIRVASGHVIVHAGETGAVMADVTLTCPAGGAGRGGAPTVADFDGDALMEVGVAGANCYLVVDPQCVGASTPAGCSAPGILWATTTEDTSSNVTSSTVFDFNGDGRAEVVYNDEENFLVMDGTDGSIIFMEPNPSRTRTEQPVVADVDNDGNAEIVFTANNEATFAGDTIPAAQRIPGVEIWSSGNDDWVGAAPIWNQHTYHISHVDGTGAIASPEPGSWTTHNTYRLNLPIEDALAAPDLSADMLDVDRARCGEMPPVLQVCALVFNRGDVQVGPGIEVVFYAGDPSMGGTEIGRATTDANIARGDSARVCVDWVDAPTTATTVYIEVDATNVARECIEDNNVVDLGETSCNTLM